MGVQGNETEDRLVMNPACFFALFLSSLKVMDLSNWVSNFYWMEQSEAQGQRCASSSQDKLFDPN